MPAINIHLYARMQELGSIQFQIALGAKANEILEFAICRQLDIAGLLLTNRSHESQLTTIGHIIVTGVDTRFIRQTIDVLGDGAIEILGASTREIAASGPIVRHENRVTHEYHVVESIGC